MSWEQYQKLRPLGHGAFGTVYLARDTAGDTPDGQAEDYVAVKCVPLASVGEADSKMAMSEVAILRQLNHRNILRFIDCFIDEDSFLCTVTEFVDGGDLGALIRHARHGAEPSSPGDDQPEEDPGENAEYLDALVVADIAEQAMEGLAYLHANSVLHRDIKPANLYITKSGVVKIGDFGVSKLLSMSMPNAGTFIGTPFYICPELALGDKYSFGADVWALGVMLYELYCNKLPFVASNVLALIHIITEGNYDTDLLDKRPYGGKVRHTAPDDATASGASVGSLLQDEIRQMMAGLIKAMLVVDPFERPTAAALLKDFFSKDADYEPGHEGGAVPSQGDVVDSSEDWRSPAELEREASELPAAAEMPWLDGNALAAMDVSVNESALLVIPESAHAPSERSALSALSPAANAATPRKISNANSPQVSPARSEASNKYKTQTTLKIHFDPVELERKIREKALLHHRKRLQAQADRRRREQAEAERKRIAAAEDAKRAEAAADADTPAPVVEARPIDDHVAAMNRIEQRAKLVGQLNPSALTDAHRDAQLTKPPSPMARLMASQPDVMVSVREVAAAIVANDAQRVATRKALGLMDNSADADDEEEAVPLPVQLIDVRNDRIVAVKMKQGYGFKKLCKRMRKALGLGPDAEIPGLLMYMDSDSDMVKVQSNRDWKHAVCDFNQRTEGKAGVAMMLRLV